MVDLISEDQFLRVLKSRMQQYVNRIAIGRDLAQIHLEQIYKKLKAALSKLKLSERGYWGYFFDRAYDGSQKVNNDSIDRIKGDLDLNNKRHTDFYLTIFFLENGYLNFRYFYCDIIHGLFNTTPLKPFSIPVEKVKMKYYNNNDPYLLLEFEGMALDRAALHGGSELVYYVNKLKEIKDQYINHTKTVEININSINQTIERGIKDLKLIYSENGAANAFDRLHSILHGVLKLICKNEGIILTEAEESKLTSIYKKIKEQHPAFNKDGASSETANIVIQHLSSVIDKINSLRNNNSLAHPNEIILNDAEAELIFQTGVSILHYLDKKVTE